jgi:hypothetical protein
MRFVLRHDSARPAGGNLRPRDVFSASDFTEAMIKAATLVPWELAWRPGSDGCHWYAIALDSPKGVDPYGFTLMLRAEYEDSLIFMIEAVVQTIVKRIAARRRVS